MAINPKRMLSVEIGDNLRKLESISRAKNVLGSPGPMRTISAGIPGSKAQDLMEDVMQKVFDESQDIVPVWTGALQENGRMEGPERAGIYRGEMRIIYGDDDVPYASRVHTEPPKQKSRKKFLERPFFEIVPKEFPAAWAALSVGAFDTYF